MNNRQFNGIYRPLVKAAWLKHCAATGEAPNNKAANDSWYRQKLHDLTKGQIHSTKGIHHKMQLYLISAFKRLAKSNETIPIKGWSDAQIARFHDLAKDAWQKAVQDGAPLRFKPWVGDILHRHHRTKTDGYYQMPDKKESFDKIMAHLAIIANDEYWIKRTAEQGEIRLKWQLTRYLIDLDYLDRTRIHDWDYIRAIYKQSHLLPTDINDCPVEILWKVLAMLDTHIRRLCKDLGLRPMELPTRAHPSHHPHTIPDDATHLHIGHELEHPRGWNSTVYADEVPF